ncbi:hypothetical protein EON63_19825 [archaeon]|nr:MAG: hypothetical protein EON63_19825 [archaeon]
MRLIIHITLYTDILIHTCMCMCISLASLPRSCQENARYAEREMTTFYSSVQNRIQAFLNERETYLGKLRALERENTEYSVKIEGLLRRLYGVGGVSMSEGLIEEDGKREEEIVCGSYVYDGDNGNRKR